MAIPFLNHIDLTKSEIRRVSLHQTTTASVGNEKFTGQIIFDTGDSKAKYYDGSAWITMGDTDNYVDGASLSNNTLTLTRTGSLADIDVDLSSLDVDNYVDGMSLSGNTLTLTRTGSLSDLTQDLSSIVPSDVVDGTGAAGQVAYWSDSDTITGENDFSWDATDNRLGVGVGLSPTANIDVKRNVNDLATTLAHTDSKAVAKFVGSTNGDGQLTISHGSGAAQLIQSSNQAGTAGGYLSINPFGGSVAIGASIGYHPLYVAKGASVGGSSIAVFENLASGAVGSIKIVNSEGSHSLRTDGGAFDIYDHGNNRITATISSAGQLRLHQYGSGTHTGTETKNLSVTSTGQVIETTPVENTDLLQRISADSTDAERYVTFVNSATGDLQASSDANFRFNPSTDTLSVTNLVVSGTQTISDETVQVVENNTILFEGATDDAYETKLTVIDPTADRTISLPNDSGTVALLGDIPTVNNGTLTVEGIGVLGGTGTFTANDSSSPTISISHDAVTKSTTTSTASPGYGATFTAIDSITTSTEGHVTAVNTKTVTLPASDNTNTQLQTKHALIDVSVMDDTSTNRTAEITHNLNSSYVIVQMYDTTTGQVVYADIDHVSGNRVDITFSSIPANDIRVVMIDAITGITAGTVNYS